MTPRQHFEQCSIAYKGYTVGAKRDYTGPFLALHKGFHVSEGYVVSRSGINPVPGAGWFHTLDEAKVAIDIIELIGEDSPKFHGVFKAALQARKLAMQQVVDTLREAMQATTKAQMTDLRAALEGEMMCNGKQQRHEQ